MTGREVDGTLGCAAVLGGFALVVALKVLTVFAALYLCGSALTSAVKTGVDDCGRRYSVETLVDGDWFCPEVSK
jgi:hypothetical protein